MCNKYRFFGRLCSLAGVLALLAGCGTSIKLQEPALPDALVEQWPLSVGVRYDKSITDFVHKEKLATSEEFVIDLGPASHHVFSTTLGDMFQEVTEIPADTKDLPALDLLIEPRVVALEFAIPSQTVTNDYAVWIKYQVKVFDSKGNLQADYPVSAYGKAPSGGFMGSTKNALTAAAELALRDAATLILTRFDVDGGLRGRQLPKVRKRRVVARPRPITPAATTVAEEEPKPAAPEAAEKLL
ncbi:MAG: hypothetical protein AAGF46_01825 [Pseudomonadota bacterium]